jgi:hypothetical protein
VGIAARDYNMDGRTDIAIVSGRTGMITILLGGGEGRIVGHEQFQGPALPVSLVEQAGDSGIARFSMTHDRPSGLSVVEIEPVDQVVTIARIPVAGTTDLLGEYRLPNGSLALAALHRFENMTTFATYERIGQESFLEQTLKLGAPSVLFGATIGSIDADNRSDVIFVYKPDDTSAVALGVAYGDTSSMADRPVVGTDIPVTDARKVYLWEADIDNDSLPDIIAVFPQTAQRLYLLRSTPDTLFSSAVLLDSLVRIDRRSLFKVYDIDHNGTPDLFAVLADRGGLGWWRNDGGSLRPWELLIAGPDISGFAFGQFFSSAADDIVVSRYSLHTIILYDGLHLPWGSR